MILIAPGWSNMPWFWDLTLSVQILLSFPKLENLITAIQQVAPQRCH